MLSLPLHRSSLHSPQRTSSIDPTDSPSSCSALLPVGCSGAFHSLRFFKTTQLHFKNHAFSALLTDISSVATSCQTAHLSPDSSQNITHSSSTIYANSILPFFTGITKGSEAPRFSTAACLQSSWKASVTASTFHHLFLRRSALHLRTQTSFAATMPSSETIRAVLFVSLAILGCLIRTYIRTANGEKEDEVHFWSSPFSQLQQQETAQHDEKTPSPMHSLQPHSSRDAHRPRSTNTSSGEVSRAVSVQHEQPPRFAPFLAETVPDDDACDIFPSTSATRGPG